MPPSHLIALSHATSGCVGVSGRLKKHGRLRPSIQKRMVEAGQRDEEKEREEEKRWSNDEVVAKEWKSIEKESL